jgi:hypothetical protein
MFHKKGRNSLIWDAIVPLRPAIDAKVFAQSGYNVHRLSHDVTQLLLHKASLRAREIEEAARTSRGAREWRKRRWMR